MKDRKLNYSVYAQTDIGLVRSINEDSFYIDENKEVFAVADGLGGLPHGDIASQTAVHTLKKHIESTPAHEFEDFRDSFDLAAHAVQNSKESIAHEFGIAATLTAIRLFGNRLYIGHVGDSGVLLLKKNKYIQLTKDHTLAQEIQDNAKHNDNLNLQKIPEIYKNSLTQFIGKTPSLNIQAIQYELEPGDRVLLYTDGVTDSISFSELHAMAAKRRSPKTFVQDIIKTAIQRGGKDNITAIALFIKN